MKKPKNRDDTREYKLNVGKEFDIKLTLTNEKSPFRRFYILFALDKAAFFSILISIILLLLFTGKVLSSPLKEENDIGHQFQSSLHIISKSYASQNQTIPNKDKEHTKMIIVYGLFSLISLFFIWAIWIISFSTKPAAMTIAVEGIKMVSGFAAGTITGYFGG